MNNKNGAKKVYMCYSVFPKCENDEFIERCFSVIKKQLFLLQIYLSRYWLQRCLQHNLMLRTHYRSALPHS